MRVVLVLLLSMSACAVISSRKTNNVLENGAAGERVLTDRTLKAKEDARMHVQDGSKPGQISSRGEMNQRGTGTRRYTMRAFVKHNGGSGTFRVQLIGSSFDSSAFLDFPTVVEGTNSTKSTIITDIGYLVRGIVVKKEDGQNELFLSKFNIETTEAGFKYESICKWADFCPALRACPFRIFNGYTIIGCYNE